MSDISLPKPEHHSTDYAEHSKSHPIAKVVFNHVDAWSMTLMIAAAALILHDALTPQNILLALTLALGYWFAFAVNDYFDAPFDGQDKIKGTRNFFVQHPLSGKQAVASAALFVTFFLAIFLQYGAKGLLILSVALLMVWAYSAPPLRLKQRPGLDLVAHAVGVQTFPYCAFLLLINALWTPLDYVILGILLLASLAAQLEQQARDFDIDSRTSKTFATIIGLKSTVVLLRAITLTIITIILVNILIGTFPAYILPFSVIGLPFMLHRLVRRYDSPRSQKLIVITLLVALIYMGAYLLWLAIAT